MKTGLFSYFRGFQVEKTFHMKQEETPQSNICPALQRVSLATTQKIIRTIGNFTTCVPGQTLLKIFDFVINKLNVGESGSVISQLTKLLPAGICKYIPFRRRLDARATH